MSIKIYQDELYNSLESEGDLTIQENNRLLTKRNKKITSKYFNHQEVVINHYKNNPDFSEVSEEDDLFINEYFGDILERKLKIENSINDTEIGICETPVIEITGITYNSNKYMCDIVSENIDHEISSNEMSDILSYCLENGITYIFCITKFIPYVSIDLRDNDFHIDMMTGNIEKYEYDLYGFDPEKYINRNPSEETGYLVKESLSKSDYGFQSTVAYKQELENDIKENGPLKMAFKLNKAMFSVRGVKTHSEEDINEWVMSRNNINHFIDILKKRRNETQDNSEKK